MSDIIQLLPDSVANQIAAGEVIQRPASVVKELIENAIDAGATMINVLVIDAGRTSIQVIDNGCGMSETDARLSFERHATSKIREASDLFALHTMGFRGEALASIAAVAQVDLKTRQQGEELGTHLTIAGSRFQEQEPCSCPVGSNFKIENIFYNVPARRRFLKSNATELNNIITVFERVALVYPNVGFTLKSNDTELYNLREGNHKQRIIDIFGKRFNQLLLPVQADTTICRLSGFVGKPESARKKGLHQFFFVNGRYMKHPYFHKAVINAYERLVPVGEQVSYFLYFEVAPESIDVNIHPVKTEIKFDNEQTIWQIITAAVKEAVGFFSEVPSLDFDSDGRPEIPAFPNGNHLEVVSPPRVKINPDYNPFKGNENRPSSRKMDDWQQIYEGLRPEPDNGSALFDDGKSEESSQDNILAEKSPMHYQYKGQYVMTAVKSGLMIIDQHRAHIRILYEQYLKTWHEHSDKSSQKMLFPEIVHFSVADHTLSTVILPELEAMGFELTPLGDRSYAVNAVPAGLDGVDVVTLIEDMVASAREDVVSPKDKIAKALALTLSRQVAIPVGQVLSNEEMESLVNRLFACENVNYTPDGKSILCFLSQQEIDQRFN